MLSRPSPAMVVACIALSCALAGSAVAGTETLNKAVTKSKVKQIAKKQAAKQIRNKASGLSVANAVNAENAQNANNATNAENAENAVNAQTAQDAVNAQNADSLGGLTADNYVRRLFAKVQYNAALPVILAGSPGVTAEPEGALGFPRIRFPQSMNNCALVATTSQAAGTSIVRHSTGASGTLVQLAIEDGTNAATRANFSLIGIC